MDYWLFVEYWFVCDDLHWHLHLYWDLYSLLNWYNVLNVHHPIHYPIYVHLDWPLFDDSYYFLYNNLWVILWLHFNHFSYFLVVYLLHNFNASLYSQHLRLDLYYLLSLLYVDLYYLDGNLHYLELGDLYEVGHLDYLGNLHQSLYYSWNHHYLLYYLLHDLHSWHLHYLLHYLLYEHLH